MRFALAGKCVRANGNPDDSGVEPASTENSRGLSSEPSAAIPMPVAVRPKKCRRVINKLFSRSGSIISALGDGFVEIQNHAGNGCPGGQLRGVAFLRRFPGADGQQLFGGVLLILV